MADLFTDRVGPAAPAAEPTTRQSQRDASAGKKRHPAKPAPGGNASGNDDLVQDTDSPPHRVDRLA